MKDTRRTVIVALFPVLFFLLMVAQKANFTRNLLVVIPFVSIFATSGFIYLLRAARCSTGVVASALALFAALLGSQPLWSAIELREMAYHTPESRRNLEVWLKARQSAPNPPLTALAGELWPSYDSRRLPAVRVVSLENTSPEELYMLGYDRIVAASAQNPGLLHSTILEQIAAFEGVGEKQRILKNPFIQVFQFKRDLHRKEAAAEMLQRLSNYAIKLQAGDSNRQDKILECEPIYPWVDDQAGLEPHCWFQARHSALTVASEASAENHSAKELHFEVMTPWSGQQVRFVQDGVELFTLDRLTAGEWMPVSLPVRQVNTGKEFSYLVSIDILRSPEEVWEKSGDKRLLGLALRRAQLR